MEIRRPCHILLICAFVCLARLSRADDGEFITPIEFVPYSVSIHIHAHLEEAGDVQNSLRAAIHRFSGERWSLETTRETAPRWATTAAWNALNSDSVAPLLDASNAEFIYLVRMREQADWIVTDVRLWEPLLRSLSPVRTVTARDPRTMPDLVAAAVWDLFRPRGRWKKLDDSRVEMQVQAAGLGLESGLPPLIRPLELFSPWIVIRKRDQSVERTVPQPWTYLVADELNEGRGTARIVSGLRSPLGLKPRGRVEFLAVAARALWSETELTFHRQSSPPQVLAAHEVQWHRDQFPWDEAHPPEIQRRLTDRFGRVTLKRDAEAPLFWLSITSGSQLLARLPVIPGEEHRQEVMLPDDSLRLQVEGQLQQVQSDLVSFVATRTALMAIARASAKKQDWTIVDERTRQLDALPTPQNFLDRVTAVRVTAVNKAKERRDRLSEQRILRMTDDTVELVKRYLNDEKIALLKEELSELRKAAVDDPAPEPTKP